MKTKQRKGAYIMKKRFKRIFDWFVLLLTGGGPIAEKAVRDGLCDFSGQGRNSYGK